MIKKLTDRKLTEKEVKKIVNEFEKKDLILLQQTIDIFIEQVEQCFNFKSIKSALENKNKFVLQQLLFVALFFEIKAKVGVDVKENIEFMMLELFVKELIKKYKKLNKKIKKQKKGKKNVK